MSEIAAENRWRQAGGAALAAFAVDQATKRLMIDVVFAQTRHIEVTSFFDLTLGFNYGISFGLLRDTFFDAVWTLIALKSLVLAAVGWWAFTTRDAGEAWGFGLILGGGLGNLLDRVRIGAVIDFLDFHLGDWRWPAFNTADIAIVLGCALVALRAFRR